MSFDDIVEGSVCHIRGGTSQTVIATKPHKEQDGMRIVAWETTNGVDIITPENFLGFEGM